MPPIRKNTTRHLDSPNAVAPLDPAAPVSEVCLPIGATGDAYTSDQTCDGSASQGGSIQKRYTMQFSSIHHLLNVGWKITA
jgi:hypothetical protein